MQLIIDITTNINVIALISIFVLRVLITCARTKKRPFPEPTLYPGTELNSDSDKKTKWMEQTQKEEEQEFQSVDSTKLFRRKKWSSNGRSKEPPTPEPPEEIIVVPLGKAHKAKPPSSRLVPPEKRKVNQSRLKTADSHQLESCSEKRTVNPSNTTQSKNTDRVTAETGEGTSSPSGSQSEKNNDASPTSDLRSTSGNAESSGSQPDSSATTAASSDNVENSTAKPSIA